MIAESAAMKAAVKAGATAAVAGAVVLPFDVWWLGVIGAGLLFGSMMRISKMVSDKRDGPSILRDFIASLLAGAGNGTIAAVIIYTGDLNMLQGLAVAFAAALIGFQPGDKVAALLMPGGLDKVMKALKGDDDRGPK